MTPPRQSTCCDQRMAQSLPETTRPAAFGPLAAARLRLLSALALQAGPPRFPFGATP